MGRIVDLWAGRRDLTRLARLVDDWSVAGAVLVDIDSGMALDCYTAREDHLDLELVGATHADLVRTALDALAGLHPAGPPTELVLSHSADLHHLVRAVDDPFGGRLALAVLVAGSDRTVNRMRRRLRRIAATTLVPRPVSARPAHRGDDGTPAHATPEGRAEPARSRRSPAAVRTTTYFRGVDDGGRPGPEADGAGPPPAATRTGAASGAAPSQAWPEATSALAPPVPRPAPPPGRPAPRGGPAPTSLSPARREGAAREATRFAPGRAQIDPLLPPPAWARRPDGRPPAP